MKNLKKILSLLLTASLCFSLFSGFRLAKAAKGPDKIVYAFVTFNNVPQDTTAVEKAINAITVPKINVEVKLKPMSVANYTQQINLSLQSGEQLDIFHSLGDMSQYIAKKEVLPLDDLLNKYGVETKNTVGSTFLKAAKANGKIYGIPTYKGYALAPVIMYNDAMLKGIGVSKSQIKSVNDLGPIFAKIQKKYPNIIPLAPMSAGSVGLNLVMMDKVDFLSDDLFKPMTVMFGNSFKVVNYYDSDQFKKMVYQARDWYQKGYIMKDAATTTSTANELGASGRMFSDIAAYAGNYAATQVSAQTGQKVSSVRLGQPYLGTTSVNAVSWAIAATCKNPEAAMKFLNLTFTNKDIINLIIWGIEGQDYVKTDAMHVKYPDGKDANSVPYTAAYSCGICGNQFIQYQTQGSDLADLKLMDRENRMSATSKAFGFIFDSSSVKTETAAVLNVINQYLPGLSVGALDPKTELPKFIKALKDAGIDTIIKEKQKQLDAWKVQNNVK